MAMMGFEMEHFTTAAKTQSGTVKMSLLMVVLYLLVSGFTDSLGRVEGAVNPVVRDVELTKLEVTPSGTRIEGTAVKARDCEFMQMDWFLGRVPARVLPDELTKQRPAGKFNFGPWLVSVTPDQLASGKVTVEVRHRCHWFFPTVSPFWPPV